MSKTIIDSMKIMSCVSLLKQLLKQEEPQDLMDLVNRIYLRPQRIDPGFKFTNKATIKIFFTAEATLIGEYIEEGNRSKIKKLIQSFANIGDANLTLVQINVFRDVISQKQEFLKTHQLYVKDLLQVLQDVFVPCMAKLLEINPQRAELINERLFATSDLLNILIPPSLADQEVSSEEVAVDAIGEV